MGGDYSRGLNAVTTALTAVLGGQTDLQAAANTLAPYAAQVIGQQWGHGEDKNTAAQMVSHAILGAALAYVNGGNPAAGGSAAVASEAAADYLTNQYKDKKEYQDVNGEFQANLLPEDVKTQIRDLTAAIGAVVGGTVGDSAFEAQISGVVAQNAVENNSLLGDDTRKKVNEFFSELSSKVKHPIDQGAIKGVGSVADGILAIADAFGDTAVSAVHCPLGTSACADAMENNRQKGQAIIDFLTNLDLKEQANKIKQSYQDLNSGDPEKVANAQRTQAEVFTSLGLSAASIKKLGAIDVKNVITLEKTGITWGKGINNQGLPWEKYVQSTASPTTIDLNLIKKNFAAYDHFDPKTGHAISDKTMDTIGSKTYQNPSKITYQLNQYVDQMNKFTSDGKGNFRLRNDQIKSKEMMLAIPYNTSKIQMAAIKRSIDYAKTKNINITVIKVK